MDELRELARGIHPAVLTASGLEAALRSLAGRVPFAVTSTPRRQDAPTVEATAYFVAGEAFANAARHAGATEAVLTRRMIAKQLSMRSPTTATAARRPSGYGPDRARRPGCGSGRPLTVESPGGGGTKVRAEVPCASS